MRRFLCCCCGAVIVTDKPQDPDRDHGFGTCDACFAWRLRASWIREGCGGSGPMTPEQTDARHARYA